MAGCLWKFALKRDTLCTSGMAMRLLNFCVANDLVLRKSFFDHKDVHLATWTGPGDRNANQSDFTVMRRGQARAMLNCRVHGELSLRHIITSW